MYITNLEDDLQKNGTKLYKEEGPKDKKHGVKNRLFERPSLVNLSHVSKLYKESGSEIGTLKKMERERTKRMQKNQATPISIHARKETS